ncbi:AbrB family transcriptional regulator [Thalassococcus profundi]|uniref:AbrB family transcriptional regulator n=1 Tax=Thalassococcus profundi TaxID=2282382 RepID=UPI00405A377D
MSFSLPSPQTILLSLALCLAGGAGGALAAKLSVPMPWMLGSLLVTALVVAFAGETGLRGYTFPQGLRNGFIAMIGVMIGTQVTPELARALVTLPLTVAALLVFVLIAHAGNYLIFHRLGGLDRATAFYSATPGGLMESILMGETVGADVRVLAMQQFLRIILVITLVPTALSIWSGAPVGTAAGVVPGGDAPVPPLSLAVIALAAAAGLAFARLVHLPASQLIGPMLLSAALTLSGLVDLHLPFWLIAVAQVVVGVSLGMRFRGVTGRLLRRSLGLSLASVMFMLAVGAALSWGLLMVTDLGFLTLLLSFAPGGVTEMSLVALSLAVSPALVTLHHVLRILMTVFELMLSARLFGFVKPVEADPR